MNSFIVKPAILLKVVCILGFPDPVRIGNDTWTASNVIMAIPDNLQVGKTRYEGLYTWKQAQWVDEQTKGWHLPSVEEWRRLEVALGSTEADLMLPYHKGGDRLKEIMQIRFIGSVEDGVLQYKGERVYFWTSTAVKSSDGLEYAFLKGLNNSGTEKDGIYHCGRDCSRKCVKVKFTRLNFAHEKNEEQANGKSSRYGLRLRGL